MRTVAIIQDRYFCTGQFAKRRVRPYITQLLQAVCHVYQRLGILPLTHRSSSLALLLAFSGCNLIGIEVEVEELASHS